MKRRAFLRLALAQTALVQRFRTLGHAEPASSPPLIAFRIGPHHWLKDESFHRLLEFFSHDPKIVDEFSFFISHTHTPLPLSVIEERALRLSTIIPQVRKLGIGAGINVLATIGHHEENLAHALQESWQRMVDPYGKPCLGSYCPTHPEIQAYAAQLYRIVAQSDPDFIWVDDDLRLYGHVPVEFTCFCDLCLRQFSKQVGESFSRDQLLVAFRSGSIERQVQLRQAWLKHNREMIANLLRVIEKAVHQVKPGLPIGSMTVDQFYDGYDFKRWAEALAGPQKASVRWRPGGGFYDDDTPMALIEKAHSIGRQVASLPPEISTIESEVENFPYQRLRKSSPITTVEASTYMAAGATGTAFNILNLTGDPLQEYQSLFGEISQKQPFLRRLQKTLQSATIRGIWPAWNQDYLASVHLNETWPKGGRWPIYDSYVLAEIGLPHCYRPEDRSITAFADSSPWAFSRHELQAIFSGGVLMDAVAWQALNNMGLSAWTGVRNVRLAGPDSLEVLTPHTLNGTFSGWRRDCRPSFSRESVYDLQSRSDTASDVLARLIDLGERDLGVSMVASENSLGGRVLVMGYYPWSQIHTLAKSSQLKAICQWLAKETLGVVVDSFARAVVWSYRIGQRQAVFLVVASLEPVAALVLRLKSTSRTWNHFREDGTSSAFTLRNGSAGSSHAEAELRNLAPWSSHLLVEA